MRSQATSRWHVLLCALLLATNSGCAAFTSTQRLDLEPFADGTIAVTSDIRYQMAGIASVYIRQHIRGPEVQNAETLAGEIRISIQNIVYYSVQLSEIGRIDVEPQHQAQAYADLLRKLAMVPVQQEWTDFPRSMEEVETIARTSATEKTLLDALKIGQPVVEDYVDSAEGLLAAFELTFDRAITEILSAIEQEHKEELELETSAKHTQLMWLRNSWLIAKYREGDDLALESLIARQSDVREFFDGDKPDVKELQRMEEYVTNRARLHSEILRNLQPRVDLYHKQLDETESVNRQIRAKLRSARIALMAWRRAHRELANGVVDPAKINVADLAISMMRPR